jgi:phage shock protein A
VQALQQADQTIETLQSNIQQLQAYISQMQVAEQVAHIEGKVKLITQQMADETKILLKQMDLSQADKEAQAKLQADYDSKQMDLQKELIKLYSTQPQVSSINPNPSLNAIDGQRNTVFAM